MTWFSRRTRDRRDVLEGLVPAAVGRWALLSTAVLQVVAPAVIDFSGSETDLAIVPASYAFVVWTPIVLGCLAAAVYGMPRRRAVSAAYRAVHVRLSLVQLLFVAWLLAATSPAVWLTVPVFAAMLALTLAALRRVLATTSGHGEQTVRRLLGGTLGVYAGWSTAAVWINLATLLNDGGLDGRGPGGALWQVLVLAAATASAVLVVRRLDEPLPYVSAVAWALAGVVVSGVMLGAPAVGAAAALGLLTVAATATAGRRRRESTAI